MNGGVLQAGTVDPPPARAPAPVIARRLPAILTTSSSGSGSDPADASEPTLNRKALPLRLPSGRSLRSGSGSDPSVKPSQKRHASPPPAPSRNMRSRPEPARRNPDGSYVFPVTATEASSSSTDN